ncbi:MAG: hypothetical protein HYZ75_06470 [Elusimicrobia bacterium]|nr:hypothetical protein [Elusimicrobiota bacterium]
MERYHGFAFAGFACGVLLSAALLLAPRPDGLKRLPAHYLDLSMKTGAGAKLNRLFWGRRYRRTSGVALRAFENPGNYSGPSRFVRIDFLLD